MDDDEHNHVHLSGQMWSTTNTRLTFDHANTLFISGIFINVFLTTWKTRGIRMFSDMTACCMLALGMSFLTLVYFATANITLVGIGINKSWLRCETISRPMFWSYLFMKAYTGIFLFKKLHEMADQMRPGWSRTTRRPRITLPYYLIFGPLALIFANCIALITAFARTSLVVNHELLTSHCGICVDKPTVVLPILAVSTFVISAVLATCFIAPHSVLNTPIRRHPKSTCCCVASLLMGMVPLGVSLYMFVFHGHEAASVLHGACACDVMAGLWCVWYIEGSWTGDRAKNCKCENPVIRKGKDSDGESRVERLQGQIAGEVGEQRSVDEQAERVEEQAERAEPHVVDLEERRLRMEKVRRLHREMEKDLDWTRDEEDPSSG